ncbi:DUF484 family protein [bacterium]|nr:DUF484 family protein [bacterium]
MADDKSKKTITAKDVASFLTNSPAEIPKLLATQPELLAACIAAVGTSIDTNDKIDDKVVNLIPALAAKTRQDARKLNQTHQSLLHVAAENMLSWTRLHHATLALLASTDLAGMCQVIKTEFPVIFDLNQCQLISETEAAIPDALDLGLIVHPADQIEKATENCGMFLGLPNEAAQKLLIKPTQSLAIIRLPDQLPDPVSQCLLLLGGKTTNSFHPNLGSDLLVLLAEMIGVTLAARLELQVNSR